MSPSFITSTWWEVEAILGQPQRFAREHGVATPSLDVVLALLRGLARAQTLS